MDSRLEFAVNVAKLAGKNTLRYFRQDNFDVEEKSDETPVTIADRSTEILLRNEIEMAFPHDAILGEEFPSKEGSSGFRWILDPIDGTKAFIHGVPLYGTLIGVEYEGKAILGVIEIPAMDERVYAKTGGGAWYVQGEKTPVRAQVSACSHLSESLILTSEEMTFYRTDRYASWKRLIHHAKQARTWGDCYGYMLVATGRAEGMVDPAMSLWDAAALFPIIQEAGGIFTDWQNVPTYTTGEAVVTNGRIHQEVLAQL
ncbi:MAG: histidinol-phosphatase [Planctomycetia bacterium]|nr:histidinol-phosphatase [Planctomycetia bacterium]